MLDASAALPPTQLTPGHVVQFLSNLFQGFESFWDGRDLSMVKSSEKEQCCFYDLFLEMLWTVEGNLLEVTSKKSLINHLRARKGILGVRPV